MNRFMRCFSSRRSRHFNPFRSWLCVLAVVVFAGGIAIAQKDTGALAGVVKDPSGAVIAGAKIRIADVERGTEHAATTNAQGEFIVSPLKIGRYQVTAEKAGFKK